MAAKKRHTGSTPPSQRPQRAASAESARRELPVWLKPVFGITHVRSLERIIEGLREKDAHGNRQLFLDDVFVAYLLAFFNPALRTLRTLEDFSLTRQAQKHLTIGKLCKSTLSDFNKLADHTRLQPVLDHLRREVLKPGRGKASEPLGALHRRILAVDGTFLKAAAAVTWAIRRRGGKTGARLDFHVDAQTWLPELIVIPENGEGEAKTAVETITRGAIHIYDRGIFSFELIAAHAPKEAAFVMRVREPGPRVPKLETVEARELTQEARDAGVISDRLVRLVGSDHRKPPDVVLREVVIVPAEDPGNPVYLLTTLLDLDASVIGLLYRNRWQIELFFRWMKSYARFDHLISHNREGVLLSFYTAVIGVTLMYLHTGHRPSKYLFIMLGMVANGSASLEEIIPILRERERQSQMQRDRVARKRAEKPR
jgi:CBS domain-containing protein